MLDELFHGGVVDRNRQVQTSSLHENSMGCRGQDFAGEFQRLGGACGEIPLDGQ